jgi:oligopeptide transport system ATP-binding protein
MTLKLSRQPTSANASSSPPHPLLSVRDLTVRFHVRGGTVHAVNGISYDLASGETLGIVGESGCGKSVGVMSLTRLIPMPPGKIEAGVVMFEDKDLTRINERGLRKVRGREIAMIFQDPMTSLNPVRTIGYQLSEMLRVHLKMDKDAAWRRSGELLGMVGIPSPTERLKNYPHEFSGGMRQRVMIAMALSCNPKLLIADEPTTALDVTTQAQIVKLVKRLRDDHGMAVIWITHDLGVTAGLVDRVIVMYAGYIIEEAPVVALYADPRHPYTIGLLGSLPKPRKKTEQTRLVSIEGTPPNLLQLPEGCPFYVRCRYRIDKCRTNRPTLETVDNEHRVACWVNTTSLASRQVKGVVS